MLPSFDDMNISSYDHFPPALSRFCNNSPKSGPDYVDATPHMERHGKKPSARTVRLKAPPVEPSTVVDRLGQLAHEVNNLLDGSMRQVGLVLHRVECVQAHNVELADMDRRLKSVLVSMQQMGRLVEQAGNNKVPIGGDLGNVITVEESVEHACAMFEQRAAIHGIAISRQVEAEAGNLPAATLPCVLLNGAKNAIEAMCRRPNPGVITIGARVGELSGTKRLILEISDEGPGLPQQLLGKDVFAPGVTSKLSGLGIGLGIVRQAVTEIGGKVELSPREGGPGMMLRAIIPIERLHSRGMDEIIGRPRQGDGNPENGAGGKPPGSANELPPGGGAA